MQELLELFNQTKAFSIYCKAFNLAGDDEIGFARNARIADFIEIAQNKGFSIIKKNELFISFVKDEKN